MAHRLKTKIFVPLASLAIFSACSGDGASPFDPLKPQPDPEPGASSFVSADGINGQETQDNARTGAPEAEPGLDAGDEGRTAEEGDIYRVNSDSGLILNLNYYRGLQVIDFSDPQNPQIIGRVQISGDPVEMYTVGDRAYLLLNNWYGYYGARSDILPSQYNGGVVVAVNLSDPTHPRVTSRGRVPGWIRTSRLTRGNGQEALFVVATDWEHTYVKSFSVSDQGRLAPRSEINLGGYVTDIQATGERLLVARQDWNTRQDGRSEVTLIDISDPNGTMEEGGSVLASGFVASKHNMDLWDNTLRVVSGSTWGTTNTNHIETYDVSDFRLPTDIDHATFGAGESLFATIFLEDKAFFVTYERVDPFHAYSIDRDGFIQERSQFIVSGWNDFFKAVSDDSRLIGVGRNDENGNKLAVSLYDIVDLDNPSPLLDRAEIDLAWGWSEASWDDRAFSVLEGATSVAASTGETETGLILLPFSGWNDAEESYISAVQIFTFSDTTLTKRGTMNHGTQVRRSFLADPEHDTTANLSEAELSLFDASNPDNPNELGRVELAPNYTRFLVLGDYGVRRKSNDYYWSWWGGRQTETPTDRLEVVALSGDVDTDEAVASVEIPAYASIYQLGERLAVVSTTNVNANNGSKDPVFTTKIDVYDFSDPTSPELAGSLTTDQLPAGYFGWGYAEPFYDCYNCYYPNATSVQVLNDALVFVEQIPEQELEGIETVRNVWVDYSRSTYDDCWDASNGQPQECSYYTGGKYCSTLTRVDGTVEPEVCSGSFYECTQGSDGQAECNEVDEDQVNTTTNISSHERYRYWAHYTFHGVDLSNASTPALSPELAMDSDQEAVSLLAKDDRVFVTWKTPVRLPGDSRPFVRYYFQTADYSAPSAPQLGTSINIPGQLIAVEGNRLLTRDYLWGSSIVESSINRLTWSGNLAVLDGLRRFPDEVVETVEIDGEGNALVSHRAPYYYYYDAVPVAVDAATTGGVGVAGRGQRAAPAEDRSLKLTILDLSSPSFSTLSSVSVDQWAYFRKAIAGRALFTVPGGLLIMNLDDPTAPYAQAYYPLRGWASDLTVEGSDIYFSAGRFGLYKLSANTFNILSGLE